MSLYLWIPSLKKKTHQVAMKDHPVISEGAFVVGNNTFWLCSQIACPYYLTFPIYPSQSEKWKWKKSIAMTHKIELKFFRNKLESI